MALNVKPMYPFDHPEVTHPEKIPDKVEPSVTKNKFEPSNAANISSAAEEKIDVIDLKKKLDIL